MARPMRWLVTGAFAACSWVAGPLQAQCNLQWGAAGIAAGTSHEPTYLGAFDPDGPGPLTTQFLVGGGFAQAGGIAANGIAWFDPATGRYTALGTGFSSVFGSFRVADAAQTSNGDLIVVGTFTMAGGVTVQDVARWNGQQWSSMGWNSPWSANCVEVLPNDTVVLGYGSGLAAWNGSTWAPLPNMPPPPALYAETLTRLANGDLVATGSSGGVYRICRYSYSGSAGTYLPGGFDGPVRSVLEMPNGDLIAGGYFRNVLGLACDGVARWDGNSWHAMGGGLPSPTTSRGVEALVRRASGEVIAVGSFPGANSAWFGTAVWNGVAWAPFPVASPSFPSCAALGPQDEVLVGGNFQAIGSAPMRHLSRWDGVGWRPAGADGNGEVHAAVVMPNGDLVVGGTFTRLGGVAVNRLARWNGVTWAPVGGGLGATVECLHVLPNGDLLVGGWFAFAGGVPVNRLARWNGTNWSAFGSGFDSGVMALARLSNGDVVAGGHFGTAGGSPADRVARWDGLAWQPLGSGVTLAAGTASVRALLALPSGELAVGGRFDQAGGLLSRNIALWNGTAWLAMPMLDGTVQAFATAANGQLLAGLFPTCTVCGYGALYGWNGSAWGMLGPFRWSDVRSILPLPGGDLLVGGQLDATVASGLARLRMATQLAEPIGAGLQLSGQVWALAMGKAGEAYVAGNFTNGGGHGISQVGTLTSTCPATVANVTTACVGPSGPLVLGTTDLPWAGATVLAHGTGFAPQSLGLSVVGFTSPATPLTNLYPNVGPNCDQLASFDAVALLVPTAGSATQALGIPYAVAFVGLELYEQFLQADLGTGPAPVLSASNALRLRIGLL